MPDDNILTPLGDGIENLITDLRRNGMDGELEARAWHQIDSVRRLERAASTTVDERIDRLIGQVVALEDRFASEPRGSILGDSIAALEERVDVLDRRIEARSDMHHKRREELEATIHNRIDKLGDRVVRIEKVGATHHGLGPIGAPGEGDHFEGMGS